MGRGRVRGREKYVAEARSVSGPKRMGLSAQVRLK